MLRAKSQSGESQVWYYGSGARSPSLPDGALPLYETRGESVFKQVLCTRSVCRFLDLGRGDRLRVGLRSWSQTLRDITTTRREVAKCFLVERLYQIMVLKKGWIDVLQSARIFKVLIGVT